MIPRVSDILRILFPNSLNFVTQADLDMGTALHRRMEFYVNDCLHGLQPILHPDIQPMVKWLDGESILLESAEEEIIDATLGYGGHPDCLATWKGKAIWIDWKFAEQITEQNQMQGTVYTKLAGRPGIFLQCPKDGRVRPIKCKPNPYLWSAFLSGLNVYKFHNRRSA